MNLKGLTVGELLLMFDAFVVRVDTKRRKKRALH